MALHVFITVGTTAFPFYRLSEALKDISGFATKNIMIFYQHNDVDYDTPDNIKVFRNLDRNLFIKMVKKSDKIITHAGPATVYLISKFAKHMPLVIPRKKKYKEHVDNHQVYFSEFLKGRLPEKLRRYILCDDNIVSGLKDYLNRAASKNYLSKYLFRNGTSLLEKKLTEYIDHL